MADSSVNYPTLSGMFNSISPVPAMMGQMQFQQALTQAKQNQQIQSDEMRMKQEMHPLEMLFKQAQTGQTNANTGLINEQTIGTKFKNQMDADTRQAQLDNLLSKYAKEKSANELQVAEDSINKTLLDDRIPPEQRQKLLQLSQFFQKTREKQAELTSQRETNESVARIHGDTSRDVARIGATSREAVATTRTSADAAKAQAKVKSTEQLIRESKTALERHQKLIDAAKEAEQAGNTDLAESYRARAADIAPQAQEELKKKQEVDLESATGGRVKATPPPNIKPPEKSKLSPVDQQALDWANANPTDPRAAKIKQKLGIK